MRLVTPGSCPSSGPSVSSTCSWSGWVADRGGPSKDRDAHDLFQPVQERGGQFRAGGIGIVQCTFESLGLSGPHGSKVLSHPRGPDGLHMCEFGAYELGQLVERIYDADFTIGIEVPKGTP